jgi:hypothetical protein
LDGFWRRVPVKQLKQLKRVVKFMVAGMEMVLLRCSAVLCRKGTRERVNQGRNDCDVTGRRRKG